MSNEELARELHEIFKTKGYEWNFPDKDSGVPTPEDFLKVFGAANDRLENDYFVIMGRLIITNTQEHKDVFVMIGELE